MFFYNKIVFTTIISCKYFIRLFCENANIANIRFILYMYMPIDIL